MEGPTVDIILGRPWLSQHSPEVIWDTSEILRWSKTCIQNCLSNVPILLVSNSKLQVNSTLVESPEPREVPTIPSDYTALQDVFSKQVATKLPPHRPWDCAIDEYNPCPSWSARRWRITSRRLSNNSSFVLPPFQQPQVSSSWPRRTEACSHALTSGPSMITLSSSLILFPWSRPPSKNSVGPVSSRSWTCGTPITSFESGKATSGRRCSLPPKATVNIWSCRMSFPTPRLPGVYERGVPGVPPPVCHRVHRQYPDLLPEPGRTSSSRDTGPTPTQETPPLPEFNRPTAQFLGYIFSADGIRMDQGKVQAIQNKP